MPDEEQRMKDALQQNDKVEEILAGNEVVDRFGGVVTFAVNFLGGNKGEQIDHRPGDRIEHNGWQKHFHGGQAFLRFQTVCEHLSSRFSLAPLAHHFPSIV
ncbi:hypothetical protein D918_08991 [Trichuris suis]|nr:hypothetical protein D918_08991 [Trichuris suis]